MIASSENTCAQVLYGPIYDHYDGVGQFDGHLGFPTTDITALPDGTSYAAFDNGVLWLDDTSTVQEVQPLPPGLVASFSGGLNPTASGIAQFAQGKISGLIATALAQQGAQGEVTADATVTFDSSARAPVPAPGSAAPAPACRGRTHSEFTSTPA
jgi:hypothetical protein